MESISIAEYQKLYGGRTKKKSNSKRSTRVKTHQGESIGESTLNWNINFIQNVNGALIFTLSVKRYWLRLKAVFGVVDVIQGVRVISVIWRNTMLLW